MTDAADAVASLAPALAFLLAGVPLAALLDELGFFAAVARRLAPPDRTVAISGLWVLAAVTTVVLNLDTTIVLLTPLYLRLARRAGVDALSLTVIPLVLASLASSVLPVSNLTTLIATDRLGLSVGAVVSHLALPSAAAVTVGWLAYRRRYPTRLPAPVAPAVAEQADDRRALRVGGAVVGGLLVGFTLGPSAGIDPWVCAVVADLVLIGVTRTLPWRELPVATAAGVALLGAVVVTVVPADLLAGPLGHDRPVALVALVALATLTADAVNNLPAVLIAVDSTTTVGWGTWAWLLGVNTGAVLVPIGALANLLWLRIVRDEDERVSLRRYLGAGVPVALPALVAAALTLAAERLIAG